MRRGGAVWRTKISTGLTGLPVLSDARAQALRAVGELRRALEAVPSTAAYRVALEKMASEADGLLRSEQSDEAVEEALDTQLEEFVVSVRDETALVPLMAASKPWDVPDDHKITVKVLPY